MRGLGGAAPFDAMPGRPREDLDQSPEGERLREVGARIRQARVRAGFRSARRFASALGTTEATAQRWERGANEPSPSSLEAIAEITGCSVDWLLSGRAEAAPTYPDSLADYLASPRGRTASLAMRRRLAGIDLRGLAPTTETWALLHLALEGAASDAEAVRAARYTRDLLDAGDPDS